MPHHRSHFALYPIDVDGGDSEEVNAAQRVVQDDPQLARCAEVMRNERVRRVAGVDVVTREISERTTVIVRCRRRPRQDTNVERQIRCLRKGRRAYKRKTKECRAAQPRNFEFHCEDPPEAKCVATFYRASVKVT